MLETMESIINADEIANTFGLDVVIQGNSDLSQFSGWSQTDARYEALLTISHNATLKAGKYWGNAGQQYLTGHPLSPSTRFVQNGPSHDGFAFPARGRGALKRRSRSSELRRRTADRGRTSRRSQSVEVATTVVVESSGRRGEIHGGPFSEETRNHPNFEGAICEKELLRSESALQQSPRLYLAPARSPLRRQRSRPLPPLPRTLHTTTSDTS